MSAAVKQPRYKRQRFLLSFVRQINRSVSANDLQKLIFLYTMTNDSKYYEFIPYKFGSYSFQLEEDLGILKRNGFVNVDYVKGSTMIEAVGDYAKENSFPIARERGNALICRTYREYPFYTINSEILSLLFKGEELKRFISEREAYEKTKQILFTIGYEGKSIEAFINTLIFHDVRLLCDVRKNPLSRKFGFSKRKLEYIANAVGIKYIHIPDLGIESSQRSSLETSDDYKNLFADYEKTLPSRKTSLDEVYGLLQQHNRIALMCFEFEPDMCHRHIIRDNIVSTHKVKSVDI